MRALLIFFIFIFLCVCHKVTELTQQSCTSSLILIFIQKPRKGDNSNTDGEDSVGLGKLGDGVNLMHQGLS